MSKYLVVANQTVSNPRLITELRGLCHRDAGAESVLLVPATPVRDLLFRRASDERAEAVARKHAEKGRACFGREWISLMDVRIGSGDAAEAIEAELRGDPDYAGVVISTLPGESSRWLKTGLPQTVESRSHLPVIHVEVQPTWTVGP